MKITQEQLDACYDAIEEVLVENHVYIGPNLFGTGVQIDGFVDFEKVVRTVARVLGVADETD